MRKKWTIIMQVSGENNLFDDMLSVMQELFEIKDGSKTCFDDVNFIVVFDGIRAKKFSKEFAAPSVYEVKPNTSFFLEYPVNKKPINEDLSNKLTLESVYNFIKKEYPADQFGFIYKGHGGPGTGDVGSGTFYEKIIKLPADIMDDEEKVKTFVLKRISGWSYEGIYNIRGYIRCRSNEKYVMVIYSRKNTNALSYRKISEVIEGVFGNDQLAFIFLDCCWGMQIENAYTFKNRCKYFIASADEMPSAGIGYADFLKKIVSRPEIIDREVANIILSVYFTNKYDDYDDDENEEFRHMGVSLTNFKMADFDLFIEKFNIFCDYLISNISTHSTLIKTARSCCKDYTYVKPEEYSVFNIDLIWFMENLLHFNKKLNINDDELEHCLLELIYILTVKLRHGYLGNNYKDVTPGVLELGGKGITITFPETREYFDESIFADIKDRRPVFSDDTKWKALLLIYYKNIEDFIKDPEKVIAQYKDFNKGNFNFLESFNIENIDATPEVNNKKIADFFGSFSNNENGKWGKLVPIKNSTLKNLRK